VRTRQRGQATPIMAIVLVMAAVIAIALIHLGGSAVDSARAQAAADAAALAGAADGPDAAAALATENGGELVRFQQLGDDVLVVVAVGRARATARARASWSERPS